MIKSAVAKLLAILLGGSAISACNSQEEQQQVADDGLTAELSVIDEKIDNKSPFTFLYSIRNGTAESVRLLPWGTPLEDDLMADSFNISYQGELQPYTGRMVKRMAPVDADYITLGANETLEVTVDLSRAYNTSQPGSYIVEIKTFDGQYSIDGTVFAIVSAPLTIERR